MDGLSLMQPKARHLESYTSHLRGKATRTHTQTDSDTNTDVDINTQTHTRIVSDTRAGTKSHKNRQTEEHRRKLIHTFINTDEYSQTTIADREPSRLLTVIFDATLLLQMHHLRNKDQ